MRYFESTEKLAYALESAGLAKFALVKEEGIGAQVPFSVIAWKDGAVIKVLRARPEIDNGTPEERGFALAQAGAHLRRAYGIDSFTVISEGYSAAPEDMDDLDDSTSLASQFVSNKAIQEVMVAVQADPRDSETLIAMCPFTYEVPRKVVWGEPFITSVPAESEDPMEPLLGILEVGLTDAVNDAGLGESLMVLVDDLGWEVSDFPSGLAGSG